MSTVDISNLFHLQAINACPLSQEFHYYSPDLHRGTIKYWAVSVRLSVCLSRASTSPYSRTERPSKPKIGRMEAHHTINP